MSGDSQKLLELADECERAGGPDRSLDLAIICAAFPKVKLGGVPEYTSSLDAALTLVPEGHDVKITQASGPGRADWYGRCALRTEWGDGISHRGNAANGALALCAAALRARAAI